jgi:hypothetical protein
MDAGESKSTGTTEQSQKSGGEAIAAKPQRSFHPLFPSDFPANHGQAEMANGLSKA